MSPRGAWLRAAGASLLGGLVMLRAIAVHAPRRYFDVDPAVSGDPLPGFGPAGSLAIDGAMLLACGLIAAGVALGVGVGVGGGAAGQRGRGVWAWLLLIPGAAVLWWHGAGSAEDQWLGTTWIAAAAAGVAATALRDDRRARSILLGLLLAAMVPILARAALQVQIGPYVGAEHAATLTEWRDQRAAFLAERGWAADSPAARIFERRLLQPQPRGWFATTNVFASLAGSVALIAGGMAVAAWRRRCGSGTVGLIGLLAVVSLGSLALTGSKGAIAAFGLAAGGLAAAIVILPRLPFRAGRLAAGAAMVAIVPLVLAAIVGRGLLPEDFAGDRSLLFRVHYLEGATGALLERPLAGHGADGFGDAYLRHRPERSPEEVASAHIVAADWLVAMGALGLPWLAGLGLVAWRIGSGMAARRDTDDTSAAMPPPSATSAGPAIGRRAALALTGGTAFAAAIAGYLAEAHVLTGGPTEVRVVAMVLAVILAVVVVDALPAEAGDDGSAADHSANRAIAFGLAGATIMLLAHGSIDMTATQPAAAAWWALALGLAVAHAGPWPSLRRPDSDPDPEPALRPPAAGRRTSAGAAATVAAATGVAVLVFAAAPAAARSARVAELAATLAAAGPAPTPEVRMAAAEGLIDLAGDAPAAGWLVPAAWNQARLSAMAETEAAARSRRLVEARRMIEPFSADTTNPDVLSAAAELEMLAAANGAPDAAAAAVRFLETMAALDPAGTGVQFRLARALDQAGRPADAAAAAAPAVGPGAGRSPPPAEQLRPRPPVSPRPSPRPGRPPRRRGGRRDPGDRARRGQVARSGETARADRSSGDGVLDRRGVRPGRGR